MKQLLKRFPLNFGTMNREDSTYHYQAFYSVQKAHLWYHSLIVSYCASSPKKEGHYGHSRID